MRDASSFLCDYYTATRFAVTEDDWPPYQPKHYTPLTFCVHKHHSMRRQDHNIISQLAVEGNLVSQISTVGYKSKHNQKDTNTIKNIAELFTLEQNSDGSTLVPNTILIEGAPGIGKTVLSKEIAYQWASKKLLYSKILLFLLCLRSLVVNRISSVNDLLMYVLRNKQMAESVAKCAVINNGEDIVIVLDGYNELPEQIRMNSFIADVIHRKVLPRCLLVIVSRPTASWHLRDSVDRWVEVVGFSEEDRLDYIKTAVLPSTYENFKQYLQSNPMINALCYIPLNMTILLCLAENSIDNLPKSKTKLYQKFIELTIMRHAINTGNKHPSTFFTSLYDLPPEYRRLFKELARFAFKGLEHDKLVFTFNETMTMCPSLTMTPNWNGLDLLNCVESFDFVHAGENVTYHFLHFSIQEYLAAYHISMLPSNQQIKLLRNTFWSFRYYNTWIMYAGITGGKNFALRHFFSGNWFRTFTWLFGSSTISKKLLKNKIKCLHIFQCLAETQDDKVISLVGNIFQDCIIDLSNQTLLPRDLSTLAFFLIRSFNKKWKKLNLSKCNVGSYECEILINMFSDDDTIHINTIDFSYNNLSLLSLVQLFDLVKSWHASELIITDNTILDSATSSELYTLLENAFVCSGNEADETFLQTVSIGSFLFAYKLNEWYMYILLKKSKCNNLYILDCDCSPDEANLHTLFHPHLAINMHILDTPLSSPFVMALNDMLAFNSKFGSLFLYDSTLSDDLADKIGDQILFNYSGSIMLVASRSTVQGILNTNSLSKELSDLEILNLIVKIRSLSCIDAVPVPSWRNDLHFHISRSESIVHSFSDMLFNMKSLNCQIKLQVVEENALIAHKVGFRDLVKHMSSFSSLTAIYLSGLSNTDYKTIISMCGKGSLSILYVLHSCLTVESMCSVMSSYNCTLQELFFHSNCAISKKSTRDLLSFCQHRSFVLVTNNNLVVHNPTNKQLALAHRLEPLVSVWSFVTCQVSAETFYLILHMLANSIKTWVELDFIDCNLTYLEYMVVCEYFNTLNSLSTVKRLALSSVSCPLSIISALAEIIRKWEVEELIISDENTYAFYNDLIDKLRRLILKCRGSNKYCLTVSYRKKKACFYYNVKWKMITAMLDSTVATLFLLNCQLLDLSECEITVVVNQLSKLAQLCIVNSCLLETVAVYLFKKFIHKELSLSIIDTTSIDGEGLYNSVTNNSLFHDARIHFIAVMNNFLCGYNTTEDQLHLLKSAYYSFSVEENKIITMAIKLKLQLDKDLFVMHNHQLKALYFIANKNIRVDAIQIISSISDASFLRIFGIDNCAITNEVVNHIFIQITGIEKLYVKSSFLSVDILTKALVALHNTSKLKCLGINCNYICEKVMDYILPILHNNPIEDLGIGGNNLGDNGTAKLANAILTGRLLQLGLEHNNITEEAADDIAAILSHNTNLTVLNLSGNNLHSEGVKKVAESLQNTSTLIELYLSDNEITKEAADNIAAVLTHNENLQILCLNENDLQTEGIIKITNSLQSTHHLQKLRLDNNNATAQVSNEVVALLSHNPDLKELLWTNLDCNGMFILLISFFAHKTISNKIYLN